MASASASVDSKAELTALLEQWEREQQGSTQELVNILTKSVKTFNHTVAFNDVFWLNLRKYMLKKKTNQNLIHVLKKHFSISELVEKETEEYHKVDPDPFDDRHPGIKSKRSREL